MMVRNQPDPATEEPDPAVQRRIPAPPSPGSGFCQIQGALAYTSDKAGSGSSGIPGSGLSNTTWLSSFWPDRAKRAGLLAKSRLFLAKSRLFLVTLVPGVPGIPGILVYSRIPGIPVYSRIPRIPVYSRYSRVFLYIRPVGPYYCI